MSNSLDTDQDRHSVGPDLGPNCLQWLSAGNKSQLAKSSGCEQQRCTSECLDVLSIRVCMNFSWSHSVSFIL